MNNTNTCKNCVCGYLYNDPNDSQDYVECLLTDDVHLSSHACEQYRLCDYPTDCTHCPARGFLCATDKN